MERKLLVDRVEPSLEKYTTLYAVRGGKESERSQREECWQSNMSTGRSKEDTL